MRKILLNKEEIAQEKEIESGEWVPIPDMDEEIKRNQSYARSFINKNKNINIRLSEWDYKNIKVRAVKEGLPYQTLVASLIHKYLTGQLKPV